MLENMGEKFYCAPARDPFNYTLFESDGEAIPLSLLTIVATDLDGDDLTYRFTTSNVQSTVFLCFASVYFK